MIKYIACLITIFSLACTSVRAPVSTALRENSTSYPVKGLNGWQVNQRLTIGDFNTSRVKRGWDFNASVQYTKMRISPEEMILKVFNVDADWRRNYQRNKFQYVMQNDSLQADVFATEKFEERQLVYKSTNPNIGKASRTLRYEYAFAAAIVPLHEPEKPWSLVLINRYDASQDTARKIFDKPYVEEEGYATNGEESVSVSPVRSDKVSTPSGEERKVIGGKLLAGYEINWNDKEVAMIDLLGNNVWLRNDLSPRQKLLLTSISSAILLKRMQDVESDRDALDE
jgi:hypothetical protein